MNRQTVSRREFVRYALKGGALCAGFAATGVLASCAGRASAATEEAGAAAQTDRAISRASVQVFDTTVNLAGLCSQETIDKAAALCVHYESLFSSRIETSDVARINAARGQVVTVDADTAEVIERALELSEATGGTFDITIGAASLLWDFVSGVRPADDDLVEAVKHIGYEGVIVHRDENGSTVQLADPDAKIDFGGIGKGYVGDKLAAFLKDNGCESALLDLGGDMVAVGHKPDGSDWNLGVRDPAGSANFPVVIGVHESGAATSGTYERAFTQEGRTYHHILDPYTGYPAPTDLASATALTPDGTEADAVATALVAFGRERALAFLNADERLSGALIDNEGAVWVADGTNVQD